MAILWLGDISADSLEEVGGKAASLGELTVNDLPVPPGFVVTAGTYRRFVREAGLEDDIEAALDIDVEDSTQLAAAKDRVRTLIEETAVPEAVREEILDAYETIGAGTPVAVRSSATAEDLPDASFAGQQETFLNVTGEALVDRVRQCWASLFTERAIYYRQEQGFSHTDVDMAVVVQEMVAADKSGVMFTSHPSTGAAQSVIEAAWGLGEAVVSGVVTPDNYVVDRDGRAVLDATVAEKTVMHVRDPETGETVETAVPDDRRTERVLSADELDRLVAIGERVEALYDGPQDVEWAIEGDEIYLLQSRPITTIESDDADAAGATADGGASAQASSGASTGTDSQELLVQGLGASPGTATGRARIVDRLDHLDKVEEGDVLVTEMTTPDMVTAMKRAAGLVTDEGGMTSHAAIVSRELEVPAVVGTESGTAEIADGDRIHVDGEKGQVRSGPVEEPIDESTPDSAAAAGRDEQPAEPVQAQPKPMTATEVKVNISIPDAAERAANTGADGVGLLRTEHLILSTDKTPERYVADHGADAYVRELADGIQTVADAFYPRPVRVRTLDAPTDEFRRLQGGDGEPTEHNPMLGYRGIRRSLDKPELFEHELAAFARLYEMGYDNVEIMFPMVNDAEDALRAKDRLRAAGIDPDKRSWGAMVETPASALSIEGLCETGLDFVSFGTNDLTQHTLAVDRNNEQVADRFDELHPAVLELIGRVIETCREHDVATSICGQAGSDPEMIRYLVTEGATSISANIDAVEDAQRTVMRVEQRCLLESVRD
ncbi:phosphoenolpyruvate synthase [Natronoarchaeum philippinense]|uniref:Phosphoenolpyruvate synthase n=1 Tax=Natronoarchaeum philippinense TaxID=558529 RepID=A0A285P4T4_NATPI|nr:phosphoenolpyruvate synthase [Natronoarchaeum philippinense]SNZ15176.1 phosphoenolpyruvate synthase [Natronoarchaeum philippinense]